MDILSYAIASKQSRRIKRFIANPDSNSGILTTPSKIEAGEVITIPAGRTAILPDIVIEGEIIIEGDVFIPSGGSYNQVDVICDNVISKDKSVTIGTKQLVDTVREQDISGKKNFLNGLTTQGENITPYSGFKNFIINGNFAINQRNGPQTISNDVYYVDRWKSWCKTTNGFSFSQQTGHIHIVAGATFTGYLGTCQKIENEQLLFAGKTITISCEVRTNITGVNIMLGGTNTKGNQHNGDGTWKKLTLTVNGNIIVAGDYFGVITQLSGTTLTLNTSYMDVRKFQVEIGSVATPFEDRPYGLELALCKRYYEIFNYTSGVAITVGSSISNGINVCYNLPITPKRSTPSMGTTGSFSFRQGGNDNNATAIGLLQYNPNNSSAQLYTSHSSVSNGYTGSLFSTSVTSIAFEAEL